MFSKVKMLIFFDYFWRILEIFERIEEKIRFDLFPKSHLCFGGFENGFPSLPLFKFGSFYIILFCIFLIDNQTWVELCGLVSIWDGLDQDRLNFY